jgi:KDO2-lipid IV(A) lauroyltransferase
LKIIAALAQVLPLSFSYFIAKVSSYLWFHILKINRAAVLENVKCLFKKEPEKVYKIAQAIFYNFCLYVIDYYRSSLLTCENISQFVKLEGESRLQAALAPRKGAIGITAHLGSWELAAITLSLKGYPVSALYLNFGNKLVDRFTSSFRIAKGIDLISVKESPRKLLKVLNKNRILGILTDRDTTQHGKKFSFLGKEVYLPLGPAKLAYQAGSNIFVGICIREKRTKYRFFIEGPFSPADSASPYQLTQKYLKVVEDYIRRYPEQWFLLHPLKKPS